MVNFVHKQQVIGLSRTLKARGAMHMKFSEEHRQNATK
jgi:hypothetical protein